MKSFALLSEKMSKDEWPERRETPDRSLIEIRPKITLSGDAEGENQNRSSRSLCTSAQLSADGSALLRIVKSFG